MENFEEKYDLVYDCDPKAMLLSAGDYNHYALKIN